MKLSRVVLLLALLGACASPEARRTRGTGRGADPGNRTAVVELHEGDEPYHETPCLAPDEKCPPQRR